MDPLTALSLASAVVQFVDFGISILKAGNEVYRRLDGCSIRNAAIEDVTTDLQELMDRLKVQPPKSSGTPLTPAQASLNCLVQRCSDTAQELLGRLKEVKANGRGIWKTIPAAFLAVWSKKDIEEISERLESYQVQLNTHILAALR